MGNSDHPLHRFDERERRAEAEQWLLDCAAVQDVFRRAGIGYEALVATHYGVEVTVPPQPNVLGRVKKLYDAMTNDARFSVQYSVKVDEARHCYTLTRSH